jgi:RNA polymerase sigma-70 factor (ECF subfamily)
MSKSLDSDRGTALKLAMNLLKPEDREILALVYFQDWDTARAAQVLGIAKDAANMRLVRARRRLAAKLADWSSVIG